MKGSLFFKKLKADLTRLKEKLLVVIEVEAEAHFRGSFEHGGFSGDSFRPWPPRKTEADPPYPLLVHTGDLKKAASTAQRPGGDRILFVLNQPYAKVHNEGGRAGRGAGFQMPKRQFIGPSRILDEVINRKMILVLDKYFKQ